jgi:hypothetical protein
MTQDDIIHLFDTFISETHPDPMICPASADTSQHFNLDEYIDLAQVLHSVQWVQDIRFKCVPSRIKEHVFWRNLILQFEEFVVQREMQKEEMALTEDSKGKEESRQQVEENVNFNVIEDTSENLVEQCLITIRLCYLYALPGGPSSSGYYASQWNLPNPIFTGAARIFADNLDQLQIRLYSRDGELFVVSSLIPIKDIANGEKNLESFIEPVKDSSRYYVIKVEDASTGRKAFLGLGFHDRANSFNFNTTITDYLNLIRRQNSPNTSSVANEKDESQVSPFCNSAASHEANTIISPSGDTGLFKLNGPISIGSSSKVFSKKRENSKRTVQSKKSSAIETGLQDAARRLSGDLSVDINDLQVNEDEWGDFVEHS